MEKNFKIGRNDRFFLKLTECRQNLKICWKKSKTDRNQSKKMEDKNFKTSRYERHKISKLVEMRNKNFDIG